MKLNYMAPKSGGEERQFCLNYGRVMESGASDHTGWNRKRIKQYVLEWFGIWY